MAKQHYLIGAGAAVLLFSGVLFGITGLKALAAFFALFIAPAYVILKNSSLDAEEKIYFSLFISLGLLPISIWAANKVIPSFRLAAIAVLALAVAIGLALRFIKK